MSGTMQETHSYCTLSCAYSRRKFSINTLQSLKLTLSLSFHKYFHNYNSLNQIDSTKSKNMDYLRIAGGFIAAGFLYTGCIVIYNVFFHPLSSYPGPKLYAASNIPQTIRKIKGTHAYHLKEFHDIYGEVVRISPNELSYNSAEAWNAIYGHVKGTKTKSYEKHITVRKRNNDPSTAFQESNMYVQSDFLTSKFPGVSGVLFTHSNTSTGWNNSSNHLLAWLPKMQIIDVCADCNPTPFRKKRSLLRNLYYKDMPNSSLRSYTKGSYHQATASLL